MLQRLEAGNRFTAAIGRVFQDGLRCVRDVVGDGACLFRAVSAIYYHTEDRHLDLRKDAITYMRNHRAEFEGFIQGQTLDSYLLNLANPTWHGGELELGALARCLNKPIIVYSAYQEPVAYNFTNISNLPVAERINLLHLSASSPGDDGGHYMALFPSDYLPFVPSIPLEDVLAGPQVDIPVGPQVGIHAQSNEGIPARCQTRVHEGPQLSVSTVEMPQASFGSERSPRIALTGNSSQTLPLHSSSSAHTSTAGKRNRLDSGSETAGSTGKPPLKRTMQ